ncbi:hypothetical protein N7508_002044 [Penicillium antarcticum]|uniref:uncharacterized protein n=1 Tax=Penicillium antarcticum TaxID=416450 RepID=UPI002395F2FC|nr:uncharacterized protein N7508_002044 [Penicillium antarcticum]KAJ5317536.1 hypothetical protein N7508_002044 [Penicillium antarcticum]
MEVLQHENFSMRMLDENIIVPRKTFVGDSNSDPAPANIITGRLILTFVAQHNTMNMTGQARIICPSPNTALVKYSQKRSYVPATCNLPRPNIFPFLDSVWTPGPDVQRHILGANSI